MASITTLDEEDQPKLLEAVDMLTTYISTHHVHLVLGGFRNVKDPNETTFDILFCSLQEFEVHCNPSYMSGWTTVFSFAGKKSPFHGRELRHGLGSFGWVLYNRRRESIFLICISHNFVFISVAWRHWRRECWTSFWVFSTNTPKSWALQETFKSRQSW